MLGIGISGLGSDVPTEKLHVKDGTGFLVAITQE